MKKKLVVIGSIIAVLMLGGCNSSTSESTDTEATTESAVSEAGESSEETTEMELSDREVAFLKPVERLPQLEEPQTGDPVATFHTNMGDIKVRLFPEYAPKAVENFTTHAQEGYYDGVIFHRVINDFMIQGGDPEGTGKGGESIWGEDFENEVSFDLRSFRGALCMANKGADTNGSQFYIVQNPDIGEDLKNQFEQVRNNQDETYFEHSLTGRITFGDVYPDEVIDEYVNNGGYPSLDMSYTIFGQVYEGMDVVDAIAATETDDDDKPLEDVIIESIEVGTY